MAGTIEDNIRELVSPLIESMGLEVWGIRYRGGRDHALLQIFIDSAEGVNADQCGDVTNMLSPALDAADLIAPAYTLEVSSPGLDRILFTREQAASYVGSEVKAELRLPVQGRRKVSGELVSVDEDGFLHVNDKLQGPLTIAFENIALMRVVPVFASGGIKKQPEKRV